MTTKKQTDPKNIYLKKKNDYKMTNILRPECKSDV